MCISWENLWATRALFALLFLKGEAYIPWRYPIEEARPSPIEQLTNQTAVLIYKWWVHGNSANSVIAVYEIPSSCHDINVYLEVHFQHTREVWCGNLSKSPILGSFVKRSRQSYRLHRCTPTLHYSDRYIYCQIQWHFLFGNYVAHS